MSGLWSENAALCERLVEIHSNPPIQWNLVIKRSDITKPSYNKVFC